MTKEDYDNIAKCIRKHGTHSQRASLGRFFQTTGYDNTHGNKIEVERLKKEISELHNEIANLKRQHHRKAHNES